MPQNSSNKLLLKNSQVQHFPRNTFSFCSHSLWTDDETFFFQEHIILLPEISWRLYVLMSNTFSWTLTKLYNQDVQEKYNVQGMSQPEVSALEGRKCKKKLKPNNFHSLKETQSCVFKSTLRKKFTKALSFEVFIILPVLLMVKINLHVRIWKQHKKEMGKKCLTFSCHHFR